MPHIASTVHPATQASLCICPVVPVASVVAPVVLVDEVDELVDVVSLLVASPVAFEVVLDVVEAVELELAASLPVVDVVSLEPAPPSGSALQPTAVDTAASRASVDPSSTRRLLPTPLW